MIDSEAKNIRHLYFYKDNIIVREKKKWMCIEFIKLIKSNKNGKNKIMDFSSFFVVL